MNAPGLDARAEAHAARARLLAAVRGYADASSEDDAEFEERARELWDAFWAAACAMGLRRRERRARRRGAAR